MLDIHAKMLFLASRNDRSVPKSTDLPKTNPAARHLDQAGEHVRFVAPRSEP